ncbi:MAG: molecular chaperone SurA [Gammaproteobacteria bacterium]|nr:molecular chaperone SurA [Gammaproteobacteria bacterium]MCP4089571.1 molecular chaperone SurA [Gammaproteobacteria bacterium]MCP4278094.1 molecular chaperone SurA [Gammaproteobacteria bacterium]MCP4832462.1 molecular chaperone SurA [Gammaproteobacteria bacterium]MCP4930154.1 molecular chaperone SurA [Gammaproteobacteria bacterium]
MSKIIRHTGFHILCAALASILILTNTTYAQTLDLSDTGVKIDGIAAVVNDGIVLQSELDEQTILIVNRLRAENTPLPPMNILQEQILERLIITQIQLQRAERAGITVSDEMLNRALNDIARRNNTTLSALPELLAQDGVAYSSYRKEMREQLAIERLRQRDVISRIGVTPRELEDYLERESGNASRKYRYKVSHIMISIPAATDPNELELATKKTWDIYDQLQNGADFSQMAVTYSDAQTALEGGSMGWRNGDALPSLFAEIVPNMQVGEIAEPIRSSSGFHIIRLDAIEGNQPIIEDQTLAKHILIKTNEIIDDDIAQQKLSDIRVEILEDGDFEAIAIAVSEDPGSAVNGGDLGWTGKGSFVPEFEQIMDSLEIGDLSQPFKSPFGWHILQVIDRRVHDTTEDVRREQAMTAIRDSKVAEETELWVRQIRDEAFVDYRI